MSRIGSSCRDGNASSRQSRNIKFGVRWLDTALVFVGDSVIGTPRFLVTNEKLRWVAALQRLLPGVAQVTGSQPETCNAKPGRLTLVHSLAHIFQRELDLAREDGRQHTAQGEAR